MQYYDAAETYAPITKSDMDAMIEPPEWRRSFRLILKSSFVSADGRFAAIPGQDRVARRVGRSAVAAGSLRAGGGERQDRCGNAINYGGAGAPLGKTMWMFAVSSGVVAPGSPAAKTAIAEATATIEQWLAAYNGRDAVSFLSFYAEDARYVYLRKARVARHDQEPARRRRRLAVSPG